MPPEGNLIRPASRPPEELLRSLGRKEDVDEVRARFGAFLSEKVSPGAFERDRGGAPFSRELLREAGRLGLFGFTVPAEVGGQGRNWRDWGLVLHELCYQCTDTAFPMLLAYCGTVTKLLWETKRADLIDRYVRPMASGECFGGFAWSEGNDPFSFTTTLKRDGAGWVLDGRKCPIADGQIADVVMTFAKNAETGDVTTVLVERGDRGVEIAPYNAMGLRSAGLASWAFSSVRLGPERVLVQADGLSYAQRFLNERRLEMCCWALGRMRSLFEAVTMDLSTRIRFRLPLIEMQTIQAAVGKMYVGLETSRIVIAHALERIERDEYDWLWDPPLVVLKGHVIEQALQLCRTIQDVAGGYAVFEEAPYERHIRDLMCLNPIAGTLMTLAVDLGGLAAAEVQRKAKKRSPPS